MVSHLRPRICYKSAMSAGFPRVIAIIALLACAMLPPARAEEPETPDTILSRISSLCHNAAKPVGIEFFVD